MVTEVRRLLANAPSPIVVTELGIVTDVSEVPPNAYSLIIPTLPSIVREPLHLLPSIATPAGISTE